MLGELAVALALAGAPQDASPRTGALVGRVECPSDRTQTYTLYLPAKYSPDRKWPLLFIFDPRGRGTFAAEIFKEAAERFGWILASSDNTSSDGEWEPNRRALAAMWPDVRRAYAVDERRIYATGFSGGATVAWILAAGGGEVAGVLGVGAPFLPDAKLPPKHVAWFGAAGRADFNFIDVKAIHDRTGRAGMPSRVEFFDGAHRWLPSALASRALGWFEVRAMRAGVKTPDPELVRALLNDELAYARELESKQQLTDAYRAYASIAADYEGLTDQAQVIAARRALENDERYKSARKLEERIDARERSTGNELKKTLGVLYEPEPPLPAQLIVLLGIRGLQKTAERGGYEGASATRILEMLAVQLAFYVPREFERKKQYDRAALALEAAATLFPSRPRPWIDLAANRALLNQKGRALAALEQALQAGLKDPAVVKNDPRFVSIAATPEFQSLLLRIH